MAHKVYRTFGYKLLNCSVMMTGRLQAFAAGTNCHDVTNSSRIEEAIGNWRKKNTTGQEYRQVSLLRKRCVHNHKTKGKSKWLLNLFCYYFLFLIYDGKCGPYSIKKLDQTFYIAVENILKQTYSFRLSNFVICNVTAVNSDSFFMRQE